MEALSREAATTVLARNRLGHLGCFSVSSDRSYVVPVSYIYSQGSLYAASIAGQKLRYLREHPAGVCLEVEEVDDQLNWTSVIVTGRFEEVTGTERFSRAADALYRAVRGPLWPALANTDILQEPEQAVLWALRVEEISGRREKWDLAEAYKYW